MPDFHQPDQPDASFPEGPGQDRALAGGWAERVPLETLRERAAAEGIAGAEHLDRDALVAALHATKPSGRNDPPRQP